MSLPCSSTCPSARALPFCQTTAARKSFLPDCPLSPLLDLGELGRKAFGEELDPAGHVHMRPSHGLERTVESCPIPVIVTR